MSIGIAIYGIDAAPPTQIFDLAQSYFKGWAVSAESLSAVNAACAKAGALLAWNQAKPVQKRRLP